MKFLQNLINRVFNHWQSTFIGLLIVVFTYMLWHKNINVTEWGIAIGIIVGLKNVFVNKDPDKTQSKNGGQP